MVPKTYMITCVGIIFHSLRRCDNITVIAIINIGAVSMKGIKLRRVTAFDPHSLVSWCMGDRFWNLRTLEEGLLKVRVTSEIWGPWKLVVWWCTWGPSSKASILGYLVISQVHSIPTRHSKKEKSPKLGLWMLGALYTRAWGPVTVEIQNISLVKNAETAPLHFTLKLESLRGQESLNSWTWGPSWQAAKCNDPWSIKFSSSLLERGDSNTKIIWPWHFKISSQPLIYYWNWLCRKVHMNKLMMK